MAAIRHTFSSQPAWYALSCVQNVPALSNFQLAVVSDKPPQAAATSTTTGIKMRVISLDAFAEALPAPPPTAPSSKAAAVRAVADEEGEDEE
jgi:hypothetical protein